MFSSVPNLVLKLVEFVGSRRGLASIIIIIVSVALAPVRVDGSLSGFHQMVWHYPFLNHGGPLNSTLSSTGEVDNMSSLGFSGIHSTAPDWQLSASDALRYKAFLDYARGHSFIVFGVTLEDSSFVTQDNYLSLANQTIQQVFNQSTMNGYGFTRFLIDVEFWTSVGWRSGNVTLQTIYWDRFVNLTASLHNSLASKGFEFAVNVPWWLGDYVQHQTKIDGRGFNALQVNDLVVDTYRSTSQDIYYKTVHYLAGNITSPFVVVANIMANTGDPYISYNDFKTLSQLLQTQHSTSPNIVGVSAFQSAGLPASGNVGGTLIPIDKLGLLAPYIGLASAVIATTVLATVRMKRKHK